MSHPPLLAPRAAILAGLHLVGRHYPAFLPPNDVQILALVDDYLRECGWASSDAISDGFRTAALAAGKFSPKFAEIVTAVHVAHRRGHIPAVHGADRLCARCGATALYEEPHPTEPRIPARQWIAHEPACPLRRASQEVFE